MSGNFVNLKENNKKSILQSLLSSSPATKNELALRSDLTFATVSNLLSELEDQNMVRQVGVSTSNGGRKPILYGINPSAYGFLGVEVRVQNIVLVILNFVGNVIATNTLPFDQSEGPYAALSLIYESANSLIADVHWSLNRIAGIGVSVPGLIDYEKGIIVNPPNMPRWQNVPFKDMLEERFHVPVQIEKGAYSAAFGELQYGVGKGIHHLIYVMVDAGIGAGIVVNGQLFKGSFSGAGEIGHTYVGEPKRRCNCGKYGCLETVASGLSIRQELKEIGIDVSVDKIHSTVTTEDERVQTIFQSAGSRLGEIIANLCNTFNPDMVVIGGAVGKILPYFDSARDEARKHMLAEFTNMIRIERTELDELAGVIGAASIALDHFIN